MVIINQNIQQQSILKKGGFIVYEYHFVKLNVNMFSGIVKEDYEQIILEQASKGWRLHTFSPLPFAAGGQATSIQLIFERKF